jgi:hypothetical protein
VTVADPALRAALDSALGACRQGLTDYQAGLLDEDELRQVLVHAGVVHGSSGAWLLDLEGGRWRQYDGLALEPGRVAISVDGVRRMHQVIDELRRQLTNVGEAG